MNEDLIKTFRSLWGGAMAVVSAGPLALWATSLQPPWPDSASAG